MTLILSLRDSLLKYASKTDNVTKLNKYSHDKASVIIESFSKHALEYKIYEINMELLGHFLHINKKMTYYETQEKTSLDSYGFWYVSHLKESKQSFDINKPDSVDDFIGFSLSDE